MTQRAAAGVRAVAPPSAPAHPSTARVDVEIRRDLDLPAEDAAALAALIESRPHVGVFLSRAWLSGFFIDPPAGVEPSIALLREGRTLRGVVPLALRRTRSCTRVGLLGGGAGSDRVDLLAERGFEAVCADAFVEWLGASFGARGFVLELRNVPGGSPLWGSLHRAAAEGRVGLALVPRDVQPLPYLDLTEPLPPDSLDKHRRWLDRRGRVSLETLQDPDEALAAFNSLVRLLHARWDGAGSQSALDSLRTQRFHRHVIPLLLGEGRLRMMRLSVDFRTIAVFYGLASARWWGYYLCGYDREWAGRIHLGRIALAAAIDGASQDGATEFDFLNGAERVKYRWPVRERSSIDADVYSNGAGPQLARARAATRDVAAALAKSARQLFRR